MEIESTVLESDIEEIYNRNFEVIQQALVKQVLITGAGGFLGRYFISIFLYINRKNESSPISVVALETYVTQNSIETPSIVKTLDKNI